MSIFNGFSLPEGAWLPPELIKAIPDLNQSQLKVLIVVIFRYMQVGGNEPTTFSDLESLCGLSRKSVSRAIQELHRLRYITRIPIDRSFSYEPTVDISHDTVDFLHRSNKEVSPASDSLPINLTLLNYLRSNGVYVKVAKRIIAEHERDYITQHIKQYEYALTIGLAKTSGFLVESIKNNWPPPFGYQENGQERDREKYIEWEETT